jgi:hypothetical protein
MMVICLYGQVWANVLFVTGMQYVRANLHFAPQKFGIMSSKHMAAFGMTCVCVCVCVCVCMDT